MKNNRNPMYLAIQTALTAGAVLAAPAVFAQDEGEKVDLGKVTTVGSHIRATDIETAAPVFVVEREDIEKSGLTDIGDLLRQIPAAGASLNLANNNGGDGSIQIDLRNLGSNRVLVLLNGRRWVRTLGGAADLTTIPTTVIERIEVLKDGASAIYGSDAIAGVINIVTRSDYEGVEASGYYGKSGQGDGARQQFNVAAGATSDKGSVFFNAEYTKIEPVSAADRIYSKDPVFATGNRNGSSGTPQGRFILFSPIDGSFMNVTTQPGSNGWNTPDDPDLIPFNNDTRFNYAPDNWLTTPQERTSIYVQGKYQLTDNISMSTEAMFNRRESNQLLAPQPLFFGFFLGARPGVDIIDIGGQNPYNPFGVDIPGSSIGLVGRRMIEAGNRIFSQQVDTYHYGLGFDGFIDVGTGWDWTANYSVSRIDATEINEGELNMTRITESLSNECVTNPSCVPLNLFGGEGTITPEMVDFITFEGKSLSGQKLITYDLVASTELAELPAGPLGFAVGYEKRRASGFDKPDYIIASGQTSGNQRNPTSGGYSVDELFVEFNVPLIADAPMAQLLELSVAARYSDYDAFGSTTNGKLGLRWKPIDELLVRATYSEGFRAPNIAELFGGGGDSFPDLDDPCSGLIDEDTNGNGVLDPDEVPDLPGCVGIPSNYEQANSQIRITIGSNPNLTPEESTSFTLGLVYEPEFVEGLTVTADYYDVSIDNVITSLSASTILRTCAETGSTLCDRMERGPGGSVIDVISSGINAAKLDVAGVDLTATYKLDTDYGLFRVIWDTSYTDDYTFTNTDFLTGENVPFNSFVTEEAGTELPRVRSNLTTDWSYGDWSVNYQMRYISSREQLCDPDLNDQIVDEYQGVFQWCTYASGNTTDDDGNVLNDRRTLGGTTYHDLNVTYHLADYNTRFTFGIDNLFDKQPPLDSQAFANSFDPFYYDGVGRFYWLRVNKKF